MPKIKTTITIDETLFLQVKELAVLLKVSRNRIFEVAMEEFFRRHAEPQPEQQAEEKINL